jgi:site-specific recombinase XerC
MRSEEAGKSLIIGIVRFEFTIGGPRAHEAAQMLISELDLAGCSVKICGKGGKERQCPLWPGTVEELKPLIVNRSPAGSVFLNR